MPRNIYVVHALKADMTDRADDVDIRKEYISFPMAFGAFKLHMRAGLRAALFEWNSDGECKRLYAVNDYLLERDLGARDGETERLLRKMDERRK